MYQPIFRCSIFTIQDPQHRYLSQVGVLEELELELGLPYLEAFFEALYLAFLASLAYQACRAFHPSTACAAAFAAWSG